MSRRQELERFVRDEQCAVMRRIAAPDDRRQFETASAQLYLVYKVPLRSCIASTFGRDPDMIDEAMQHAFLQLIKRLCTDEPPVPCTQSQLPWLVTAARRHCLSQSRKIKVRRVHAEKQRAERSDRGSCSLQASNESSADVVSKILMQLHAVNPQFALVVQYRDLQELETRDVAQLLGTSTENAARIYERARKELRNMTLELLKTHSPSLYAIVKLIMCDRRRPNDVAQALGLEQCEVERRFRDGKQFVFNFFTELILGRAPAWIWEEVNDTDNVTAHLGTSSKKGAME